MRRFACLLALAAGCAAPREEPPGRSPGEWLAAIEQRYLEARTVTIRTLLPHEEGVDPRVATVEAFFDGDERCRINMGSLFYVSDGRTCLLDSEPTGRMKCGPIVGKAVPRGGELMLLGLVRWGFRGMQDERPVAPATAVSQPESDVLEYGLQARPRPMRQRIRFDPRTLVIIERTSWLGSEAETERWETVFDADLPDALFVVPMRK